MSEFTNEQIKDILRGLIEENSGIPASAVRDDSTIEGDLAMDSMSFVSLQVAVEETFGISCTLEDLESANSFESIAELVHERTSGKSSPPPAVTAIKRPKAVAGSRKRRARS